MRFNTAPAAVAAPAAPPAAPAGSADPGGDGEASEQEYESRMKSLRITSDPRAAMQLSGTYGQVVLDQRAMHGGAGAARRSPRLL
eukprot:m.442754 g.442754  ORF g.442754 m.442754 type:complete len:85 (+) comp20287_c0_seq2:353-607(+)